MATVAEGLFAHTEEVGGNQGSVWTKKWWLLAQQCGVCVCESAT